MKKCIIWAVFLVLLSLVIGLITHRESALWFYDGIVSKEYDNAYAVLDSMVSDFTLTECHIVGHVDGKSNELYEDGDLSEKSEYLRQILSAAPVAAITEKAFRSDGSEKALTVYLKYSGDSPSLGERDVFICLYDGLIRFEITHKHANSLSVKRIFYPGFRQYRYFKLN